MRLTDIVNSETLLRLVQSIPSQKAEPIKLWLAKVGCERELFAAGEGGEQKDSGARLKESASKTRSHGLD